MCATLQQEPRLHQPVKFKRVRHALDMVTLATITTDGSRLKMSHKNMELCSCIHLTKAQLFEMMSRAQRGTNKKLGVLYLYNEHNEIFWNMFYHFGSYKKCLLAFRAHQMAQ